MIARPYPISNSQGIRSRGTNHGHLSIKFTFSQEGPGWLLHCEQGKGSQCSLLSLKVSDTEIFQSLPIWLHVISVSQALCGFISHTFIWLLPVGWLAEKEQDCQGREKRREGSRGSSRLVRGKLLECSPVHVPQRQKADTCPLTSFLISQWPPLPRNFLKIAQINWEGK